jgi:hypothetical protein
MAAEIDFMKGQIAKTILEQLGGNKFTRMTGAKHFIALSKGLQFSIPKAKDGINRVCVTLNGNDLYDVGYLRYRNIRGEPILKCLTKTEGLYADMLKEDFTAKTGLYTSL